LENIQTPSNKIVFTKWLGDCGTPEIEKEMVELKKEINNPDELIDEMYDRHISEIDDWWYDREWYPMWNTLFEARDEFMSEDLLKYVDELYEIGIGVIDSGDETNAMMFIAGAGYDFYDAHWIPFYVDVLKWVNVEELMKKVKITK